MFRFNYSIPFLRWALGAPNVVKEWLMGVRVAKNNKLIGFITGVPLQVAVKTESLPMVAINFLCVHKKLREKRLAPVLIKEITRRINFKGVWQAVYTAHRYIPTPYSETMFYNRLIDVKKLFEVRQRLTLIDQVGSSPSTKHSKA